MRRRRARSSSRRPSSRPSSSRPSSWRGGLLGGGLLGRAGLLRGGLLGRAAFLAGPSSWRRPSWWRSSSPAVFFAAVFFAVVFLAAVFLAGRPSCAAVFLAVAVFLAGPVFLAAVFLGGLLRGRLLRGASSSRRRSCWSPRDPASRPATGHHAASGGTQPRPAARRRAVSFAMSRPSSGTGTTGRTSPGGSRCREDRGHRGPDQHDAPGRHSPLIGHRAVSPAPAPRRAAT